MNNYWARRVVFGSALGIWLGTCCWLFGGPLWQYFVAMFGASLISAISCTIEFCRQKEHTS